MTVINHKSISGVTSITAPAGSDNLFTVHTNDTTERFRIDASGHQNISGIITAANFKTGTSNLHNTGLNIQDLDVDGHTNLDNVSIAGVVTATTFKGDGDFVELDVDGHTNLDNVSVAGVSTFTVGTNKSVQIYAATHNDESQLGAGIGFSRQSDGATPLSGIFGHSNSGLGIAARDHITFLTGGTSLVNDTEERLRITSAGKVVIGDTNSDSLFGVYRASHQVAEFTNTNADATGAEIYLRKDSSSPADNDSLGLINFVGDNDSGEKILYSYIRSRSTDVSDSTEDGDLGFFTRGAGTLGERLCITSNGSVNIGTGNLTQSDRMLNVYGGRVRIEGIPANSNSFEVYANATSGQSHGMMLQAGTTNADINANFRNTSGSNLLRVRGDGVVLIGNSVVQQGSTSKLEVMGTLNNSYPGYSYPLMVSDDAAYDSSGGPGGGIGFSFKQTSGGSYAQAGGIRGIKENTTNANYASALTFYTRADQAGTAERLRITSDGRLFVNTTAVTNTDDALTIKRPAGSHSVTSLTVDATTATGSYANALIFTKAKDYYYNGIVFTSSDGHQGGIAGKMTTNGGTTPQIEFRIGGTSFNQSDTFAMFINADGDLLPGANGARDLGSSSYRWENLYTSDLDLSNESKGGNEVDGTWGAYTIQEGEDDLFLINRRNGKKYKFNLTEVD